MVVVYAYLAARHRMGKSRTQEFRKAYNYLQKRTKWMRYSEYKKSHIPLGSGITEAACKTVYTSAQIIRHALDARWRSANPHASHAAAQPHLGRHLRPDARDNRGGDIAHIAFIRSVTSSSFPGAFPLGPKRPMPCRSTGGAPGATTG
ncbi:MAG: hypothetical protein U0939_04235 [Pirellulales bacterium]